MITRLCRWRAVATLILLLAAPRAGAQAVSGPDEDPLPDEAVLLAEVLENQGRVDDARQAYTYTMTVTDLGGPVGSPAPGRSRAYEVFFVAGKQFRRLTSRDGRPLASEAARKEEKKVAKAVREHRERAAREAAKRRGPGEAAKRRGDEPTASDILRVCRLVNPRREALRGRPALAYDFEPRPGARPKGRAESWMRKTSGRLWIDEGARRLLRMEARVDEALTVGGGLVASVRPGSSFVFEQALVDGEVWLPTYAEIDVSARVLLLKGVRQHQEIRFADYRRFVVETSEEVRQP
jgi:hypothetical protein